MPSQVTHRMEFECCYLINKDVNAHRYRLEVTVEGPQRFEDFGSVIEFSKLREYVKSVVPDKSFLIDTSTENLGRDVGFMLGTRGVSVRAYSFQLSAENLCSNIGKQLQSILDSEEPGVTVVEVKLRENNDSFASWRPDVRFNVC